MARRGKSPKARPLSAAEQKALTAQLNMDAANLQSRISGGGRRWKPTIPYEDRRPGPVKKVKITDELRRKYEGM